MKTNQSISRRALLKTTAVGGGAALAGVARLSSAGDSPPAAKQSEPDSELERVLRRCGAEFGDISRIK